MVEQTICTWTISPQPDLLSDPCSTEIKGLGFSQRDEAAGPFFHPTTVRMVGETPSLESPSLSFTAVSSNHRQWRFSELKASQRGGSSMLTTPEKPYSQVTASPADSSCVSLQTSLLRKDPLGSLGNEELSISVSLWESSSAQTRMFCMLVRKQCGLSQHLE